MKRKSISIQSLIAKIVVAWFLIAFIIFPVLDLCIGIFFENGKFTAEIFNKVLNSPRAMKSLRNSFVLAFSLIVTVNIVGTLCVLFTEYWEIKGAIFLRLAYMSSLVYGGIVLVTGYKAIYGANGFLTKLLVLIFPAMNPNWFIGYGAVVFVMTFACTQNHMMFLRNAIHGIDYHTIEAAKNMGASGGTIFFKIVMPTLKPTFFAITVLTFLTGLSALSAPMIVGGVDFQTINPMIKTFADSSYSRKIAAFLAILLGIATVILLMIFSKIEKGGNYISVSKTKAKIKKQKINNPLFNIVAHMIAWFLFAIYVAPIILVIVYSFCNSYTISTGNITKDSFTLANYARLFTAKNALNPYLLSIAYSLVASATAIVIGILCVRFVRSSKNKLNLFYEYGALLPWLLPPTLTALALIMVYGEQHIILFNKVLIGTVVLLLIGYTVAKLPFSYRMVRAAFFSIDKNLEEAATCMGASTLYTMIRVVLPVILPALLSILILNFNGLLSEYDMTVFLYHPLFQPLGIVIKAASDESADITSKSMAFVYTVILMVLSSITLYFGQGGGMEMIKKLRQRRLQKKVFART